MKNKEMILTAIKNLSNREQSKEDGVVLDLLRRFLLSNEPYPTGKFDIYKYVGKDIMNKVVNGVFYQDGKMIATDNVILVALDGIDYDPAHEGKILDKELVEIEGRFPNWRGVIPDCANSRSWKIDRYAVSEIIKSEKARKQEFGERECFIVINGVELDAKRLLLLIDFADHIGATEILTNGEGRSVVVKSGESVGLLFPRQLDDYTSHESDDILVVNLTPEFI